MTTPFTPDGATLELALGRARAGWSVLWIAKGDVRDLLDLAAASHGEEIASIRRVNGEQSIDLASGGRVRFRTLGAVRGQNADVVIVDPVLLVDPDAVLHIQPIMPASRSWPSPLPEFWSALDRWAG